MGKQEGLDRAAEPSHIGVVLTPDIRIGVAIEGQFVEVLDVLERIEGQLLQITQHQGLFSKIGDFYGGDGRTTFALPDLRGRTANGDGTGAGLSTLSLAQQIGAESVSFDTSNLAPHSHTLPGGGTTSVTGGGTPYNNVQPGLGLNYYIVQQGVYPSRSGVLSQDPTIGFVSMSASPFLDPSFTEANGQLLPIAGNDALFSVIGTIYGGDGRTTFALPDLQGRTPLGAADQFGAGLSTGVETLTMSEASMASHDHGLPPSSDTTGATGSGTAVTNMQPTLTLNYLIRTEGTYPSRSGGLDQGPYMGEIALFAGNFAPTGWMLADGTLLSIAQHTALFSILGTTYGGDGRQTFALPDLRGFVALGAGQGPGLSPWRLGQIGGTTTNSMTLGQLPSHTHSYTVPDPQDVPAPVPAGFIVFGLAGLGLARRWAA